MLKWKQAGGEKLHRYSRVAMAAFCLFLVLWLAAGLLSHAAGGNVSLNQEGLDAEEFWYGRKLPSQAYFWQQVTVQGGVDLGNGSTLNLPEQIYDETYQEAPESNGAFWKELDEAGVKDYSFYLSAINPVAQASTTSITGSRSRISQRNTGNWLGSIDNSVSHWTDSEGAKRYYQSLNYYPWSNYTETYYRAITDSTAAEVNLSEAFLEYYQNEQQIIWGEKGKGTYPDGSVCFEEAIVFAGDKSSRVRALVDGFAEKYGLNKYQTGSRIPLEADGKNVVRIEMLTIQRMDFYGSSYSYIMDSTGNRGSIGYNHIDVDFVLHTSHNYKFDYEPRVKLEMPTAFTEAGAEGNHFVVSHGESVFMENSALNPAGVTYEYYLSNQLISDPKSITRWLSYKPDDGVAMNGETYLYVRCLPDSTTESNYRVSDMACFTFSYRSTSGARVLSTPVNGGSIDVGVPVRLSIEEETADKEACTILYSLAEDAPIFTKVSVAERTSLELDLLAEDLEAEEILLKADNRAFVRLNGLWYECTDPEIEQYDNAAPPVTDESLRWVGYKVMYVQAVEKEKELGAYKQLRFNYLLSEQTPNPIASPATDSSKPTEVVMLQEIKLTGAIDSTIFYTLNGSMPSVTIVGNRLVPGNGTYIYDKPIVVTESFASYGKSFTLMTQAVTYNEEGWQIKKDSEVVRYTYKVASQSAVAPVSSIPATSAERPTEVKIGTTIQLYSNTEGVAIFYTLDGSEPVFDVQSGRTESASTFRYDGTKGIVVNEVSDSSQLLITAVACKIGMASSEISRIIYQYPDAVAAPYAIPASGKVVEGTELVLKTSSPDAMIYYEVSYDQKDPKDPTDTSIVFDPQAPIRITKDMKIKAVAVADGLFSNVSSFAYEVADKLTAPAATVSTGMMVPSGTVINLNADSGATVYYTLDGSDPKDSSNKKVLVGSSVIISGDPGEVIVLRAYAAKDGFSSSATSNYSYSISSYEGGIYANLESGSVVKNGELIVLNTDMSNAEIYYTTDGTTPTVHSNYGRTVSIQGAPGENITIMAMAVASGTEKNNSYAIFTYKIIDKLSPPTASVPNNAIFTKVGAVALTSEAGRIYYTTDGTQPTTASAIYREPIEITRAVTIQAIAVSSEFEQSEVSVFHYGFAKQVAPPTASFASGELEMGTQITFTSATEGATIYYRTDGGELNLARKSELEIYTEPITINKATTFKVIAVKDKMQDSNVLTVGYTVREPVIIEEQEEQVQQNQEVQTNRLQSRRSFSDAESGPSFTDVILRNASYGALVAAEEGSLPDMVQLVVAPAGVTDAVERRIKQVISENYGVVAGYDVTLLVNGEEAQPNGVIEIGLPIPVAYENAMIYIVHVQDDGNIELFETRRSGGMAYAKVDHLSVYAIASPVEFTEEGEAFNWLPVIYGLAVAFVGIGVWLICESRKEKREDGMQNV